MLMMAIRKSRPQTVTVFGSTAGPMAAAAYDLKGLRLLLAARRRSLGLTQLDVDAIAGLASGHTGKIECGAKGFGDVSLGALLGALRAGIVLAPTKQSDMPEDIRAYHEKSEKLTSEKRRLGGIRTTVRMTPEQRSERARAGGLKRWADWRAAKAAKRRKKRPSPGATP